MTWLELFRTKNFPQALAKRRNGIMHIDPILKGKAVRQIKHIFEQLFHYYICM